MVRWLAVLRSCGSAEAYSHYYALRIEPARVIEFLLLNPLFPQSIRFCLETAMGALEGIAGPVALERRASARATWRCGRSACCDARLRHTAVDEVLEEGLESFLEDVQHRDRRSSRSTSRPATCATSRSPAGWWRWRGRR